MKGRENVRFSAEQVMRGIRQRIDDFAFGPKIAFDETTPLSEMYHKLFRPKARCPIDECPLEFLEELSHYVGLSWGQDRWAVWLQLRKYKTFKQLDEAILQRRTVGDIARQIATRAPGVSLEPISVFGRKCEPAGAFLGIVQLSHYATEGCLSTRIAPSTKLRDALPNRQLDIIWQKLSWISGKQIPSLTYYGGKHRFHWPAWLLAFLSTIVMLVAVILAVSISSFGTAMVTFFAAAAFGLLSANCFVRSIVNPLPLRIETFGDLARLVAT